jgi:ABC-2 type transport system permease protein
VSLGLFLRFAGLRARERTAARGAFGLGVAAQMLGWAGDYAVVWLLLHRFESLGGWTWPQVAFLFSLELCTYALAGAFVANAMFELEQLVADGGLEALLTRPLDPLLHVCARRFQVGYLAHLLTSGLFLGWAAGRLDVAWDAPRLAYLAAAVAGGACLQAALLILLGALPFVAVRASAAWGLYYPLKGFLAYPLTLYGAGVQWLLTLAVPLAFVNFYPAALLLGKGDGALVAALGWVAPLVGPALLLVAARAFGAGVARYQGASG